MKFHSLLGLITLLASSAAFTNTAEAGTYSSPDLTNPIESKISALKNGPWNQFLNEPGETSTEKLLARGAWGNGRGVAWGNGAVRRGGGWGNGAYRPSSWGNGYYGGGWRNGGGAWRNGNGKAVRW